MTHQAKIGYSPVKTKAALKRAVKEFDGQHLPNKTVWFESCNMVGDTNDHRLDESGDWQVSVVGPDPYRERTWYATVRKQGTKITVS